MQFINAVNKTVDILLMSKELRANLLEHIASVIDHSLTREPVKLHDGIRELSPTRNDPGSKDLETVVFDDQAKFRAVPGQALDHFSLFRGCLQIGRGKFILNARIKF